MREVSNFTVRDLSGRMVRFRNLEGRKDKYNDKGQRSCHIVLDHDFAKTLEKDGWNIRWREPREEGDDPIATLQIFARYDIMPPKIWIVTNKKKTLLDENTVKSFDWAEIEKLSVTVRPYVYDFDGRSGVKAYIKTMYVTIVEDELDAEFDNLDDGSGGYTEPVDEELPFE